MFPIRTISEINQISISLLLLLLWLDSLHWTVWIVYENSVADVSRDIIRSWQYISQLNGSFMCVWFIVYRPKSYWSIGLRENKRIIHCVETHIVISNWYFKCGNILFDGPFVTLRKNWTMLFNENTYFGIARVVAWLPIVILVIFPLNRKYRFSIYLQTAYFLEIITTSIMEPFHIQLMQDILCAETQTKFEHFRTK